MKNENKQEFKRGDVLFIELPKEEHVQGGIRPCVVVQNDVGNLYSPNIVIIPITSQEKAKMPTHIMLDFNKNIFDVPSMAMCETLLTVSKNTVSSYLGHLTNQEMRKINKGLCIELGI